MARTRQTKTRRSGSQGRIGEVERYLRGNGGGGSEEAAAPRSYVAKYWSIDRGPMLGGVMRSESSPWSDREDAEAFLQASIENNASAGRRVEGEVVPSSKRPQIKRHCPGYPAQAVGGRCFGCHQIVQ